MLETEGILFIRLNRQESLQEMFKLFSASLKLALECFIERVPVHAKFFGEGRLLFPGSQPLSDVGHDV